MRPLSFDESTKEANHGGMRGDPNGVSNTPSSLYRLLFVEISPEWIVDYLTLGTGPAWQQMVTICGDTYNPRREPEAQVDGPARRVGASPVCDQSASCNLAGQTPGAQHSFVINMDQGGPVLLQKSPAGSERCDISQTKPILAGELRSDPERWQIDEGDRSLDGKISRISSSVESYLQRAATPPQFLDKKKRRVDTSPACITRIRKENQRLLPIWLIIRSLRRPFELERGVNVARKHDAFVFLPLSENA